MRESWSAEPWLTAEQSPDLGKEDLREGCDGLRSVGEKAPQPLRHRDHPLTDGNRRDDVIDEVGRGLRHETRRRKRSWADWGAGP